MKMGESCTMTSGDGFPKRAFTLLELLTVIAIIGVLTALFLPILVGVNAKVHGIACLNNLKQLQAAMLLYANDNDDFVVWNWNFAKKSWVSSGTYARWASDLRGCTNLQWLTGREYAAFADYVPVAPAYKCPADRTKVVLDGRALPWARSYGATFIERKMCDFDVARSLEGGTIAPAVHYTFNEPHAGYLLGLAGVNCTLDAFSSFPAYRHRKAGAFAFVDGHAELHRWIDPRTLRPIEEQVPFQAGTTRGLFASPRNPDLRWLAERTDSGEGYRNQDLDILEALTTNPDLWVE
jgi:prepilin-type N-terminal cleavage/methylation domain-containing protein/prepilin-type processing-associated H-X9-DG protein